jgi:epoxyqueuosine reductase
VNVTRLRALKDATRDAADELGFARCGFASASPLPHEDELRNWIESGKSASMAFVHRSWRQRAHPEKLLTGATSAIVVALQIYNPRQPGAVASEGRVARYARGRDYHRVVRERLTHLWRWLRDATGDSSAQARIAVDTAPLLERELAVRAGLGFIGKNTMLIIPGVGSHTVLGTLLTTIPFPADKPQRTRCGRCNLCLRSCPADALVAPYQLDARRCISYLTIEHRGCFAVEGPPSLDGWVFGCDACQEVCPFNTTTRHGPAVAPDPEVAPDSGRGGLPLTELLTLRSGDYRRMVRDRALSRVSRPHWKRNAAAASADRALDDSALDQALERASEDPREPVATTAAWASARRDLSREQGRNDPR